MTPASLADAPPTPDVLSEAFIHAVCQRLGSGKRVRRTLPNKGRLHIDRPLPFLCVFRTPDPGNGDVSGRALVRGEGSYLIAPRGEEWAARTAALVEAVVRTQTAAFGAFLLLEIWIGPPDTQTFRVTTPPQNLPADDGAGPPSTVDALCEALTPIHLPGLRRRSDAPVCTHSQGICAPPGQPPLLTASQAEALGCLMLGLEVPPLHRSDAGKLLPLALRTLHTQLAHALRKTFYEFARVQTNERPQHYQALGGRALTRAVWEADHELAALDRSLDFLLNVTPVNSEEAWTEFKQSGFARAPVFHYRMLTIDPDRLKRRLHTISLEGVEDPTLAYLFRAKRRELDRQITLLEDRDTPAFLGGSLALYGGVSEELLGEAERILSALPTHTDDWDSTEFLDAAAFAERAHSEIAYYRERWPALTAEVRIRSDIPGVMVAEGNLLIGQRARVAVRRADALLHHEVGTHILTHANGAAQPFRLLACGLPGYEELQEGIAVLAEYLANGLTRSRLRLLAARVIAVRCLIHGATFPEVFHLLREKYGFASRTAFGIVLRVFRSGGLTKDAVYLSGLLSLLRRLRTEGNTGLEDLLWIGKIGEAHLPLVEELRWREVLRAAPLRPHYLEEPGAVARLEMLRTRDVSLIDLVTSTNEQGSRSHT